MQRISLYYCDIPMGGTSDKEYHVQIEKDRGGFVVNFQYGRRGGTLQNGTKTPQPVTEDEALLVYNRLVAEKTKNGYRGPQGAAAMESPVQPKKAAQTKFPVELLEEIDNEQADTYVKSSRYIMQVKVDGHRRQIEKTGDGVSSYNRKGESKALPSETARDIAELPGAFLLDGELVGNDFIAFDLLTLNGASVASRPYWQRLSLLKGLFPDTRPRRHVDVVATWETTREKTLGLHLLREGRAEGVVFKLTTAPYCAGRNGQHKKLKFVKSCTCKVIRMGEKGHDSVTLGLFDGRMWREVGRASMIGKDRSIKVGSLVEVKFLYATEGRRLYQPRLVGVRTDVTETACTLAQLAKSFKEGVAA